MTYYLSNATLNPAQSLTRTLANRDNEGSPSQHDPRLSRIGLIVNAGRRQTDSPALRGIDEGAINVLDIALAVIAWSETHERQAAWRTAMTCKFDECLQRWSAVVADVISSSRLTQSAHR